jgi:hypothetical protein
VVLSFSAILAVDKPLLIKDQTVFCLWLNGDAKVQDTIRKHHVNNKLFTVI